MVIRAVVLRISLNSRKIKQNRNEFKKEENEKLIQVIKKIDYAKENIVY